MRNIWTIAKKEFSQYLISPVAYAVAFAILLILGVLFYINTLSATVQQYAPTVQIVLGPLVTLFLFTTPGITMRSLAEEQKNGTLEILLTAPVRDWEVIVGKWLGGVMFLAILLLITWIYPIILNQMVKPGIDQGLMASGYLGLLLLASSFLAIGIMISSFFSNQIAAFFTTLGVLLVWWMIGYPAQIMGTTGGVLDYLDLSLHYYNTFYRGIVDLKDIIFYLSVIIGSLFIGSVSIETRRWR